MPPEIDALAVCERKCRTVRRVVGKRHCPYATAHGHGLWREREPLGESARFVAFDLRKADVSQRLGRQHRPDSENAGYNLVDARPVWLFVAFIGPTLLGSASASV
jgi:hypothetical protein